MSRFGFQDQGDSNGTFNDAFSFRARNRPDDADNESRAASPSVRLPPARSAARDRRAGQFGNYGGGNDSYDPYRDPPRGASPFNGTNGTSSPGGGRYEENPYANSSPYSGNTTANSNPYSGSTTANNNPYSGSTNANNNSYAAGTATNSNPYSGSTNAFASRYSNEPEEQPSIPRVTNLERAQAKRRSGETSWGQRSPSRRPGGYGDGSRQIEEVLKIIKRDWAFMTEEKCVPVQVALQFMDNSSLGLASRYPRFRDLHAQLQAALRQIVNEQHQGFNSSIGRYHAIQSALSASHTKLRQLKENMGSARRSLETTRPELMELAKTSQNYDGMLLLLSSIEQLQAIPEKLEARISEKRFFSAVELLQEALKSIRKDGMDDIGALRELRVYLSNQEHSITDILIEELHNHLYLKSPYCEDRWKQHASSRVKGIVKKTTTNISGRELYQFLDQLDTDTVMRDDPTKNPEADTFSYIHLIIESLSSLGRLDVAVETLAQRLPVELFRVVEKCSNEVDQRYPTGLRTGKELNSTIFDFSSGNSPQSIILNDLFGTIFARFEAIAEGHRVVHEVISGITKREGTRGSGALTSGFRELWKLYQSEIRSLFHDYLATSDAASKRRDAGSRGSSVFTKNPRDKAKKMFALRDMDSKSSDLITEKESLQSILTHSVPGLVSESKTSDGTSNVNSASAGNNPSADGSATGHKLLLEPSVFNMAILLPPSLNFLNRLKEVVPSSADIAMSTLTSFLDDFLINVFLPQLDETLIEMSARTFIEVDAFTQDPDWQQHAKRPIFKGTTKFYNLIEAFCKMLDILPHDQAFTQLVITQIVAYYDKCCGWYKVLTARTQQHPQTGKRLKMSASLLEDEALKSIVEELLRASDDRREEIISKETTELLRLLPGLSVEEVDLILDRRSLAALCLLSTSMKWLANKIKQLRFISTQAQDLSKRHSERFDKQRRWTLITTQQRSEPEHVFLPLTDETAAAFDGVHEAYVALSSEVLRLLHVEVRTHVAHFIQKSMSRTFMLDQELNEPDPEIVALNADLVGFDEELAADFQASQRTFITSGLATLLDALVISWAPSIQAMNVAGCSRLQLNILVLQQNLKNIEANAQLRRSAVYFDMFSSGPDVVIAEAKNKGKDLGFSYVEMEALLKLCYSESLRSDRREVVVAAERGLADRQLQLSEFLW